MKMKQKFVGLPGLDEFIRGQITRAIEAEREASKARIEELEATLKPFAGAAERMATEWSVWEDHESHWSGGYAGLNVGDLRAARAAISDGGGD